MATNGTTLLPPRASFGERLLRRLLFIGPETHKEDLKETARIINARVKSDLTLARHNEDLERYRRNMMDAADIRRRRENWN